MQDISPWLGNLHDIPGLNPLTIRFVTILVSVVCGALVGLEREPGRLKNEEPSTA